LPVVLIRRSTGWKPVGRTAWKAIFHFCTVGGDAAAGAVRKWKIGVPSVSAGRHLAGRAD
jgi:hypothetical protein